ncbi:MAG: SDR family oxidoreductase [Planctomycetota bacterium]|jgi:uncharacterized protein YbjT (DUF2867 family)
MGRSGPRLFCDDLGTEPLDSDPLILVTGASGYIGGRLAPELLARGYRVRAMFRHPQTPYARLWKGVEAVYADCLDADQLRRAVRRVDIAYFLIHSLAVRRRDFETPDLQAASTFRGVAAECGVKRIIYLGALHGEGDDVSTHLRSRSRVEEILAEGPVPVTTLRAGVIVGSGSASFEMIRSMAARHHFLPIVRAFRYRCQPIAVRDVMKYLVGALEVPETAGRAFDIGGPDALTYREMLLECAGALGRKVRTWYVPDLWPGFVAWWLSMATPVPRRIAAALLASLRCDVVCREEGIRAWFDFRLIPFHEAVLRALRREALDDVPTRWADASLGIPPGSSLAGALAGRPLRRFCATRLVDAAPERVFARVVRIGGAEGWLHANWAWRLRGFLDRLGGGVGLKRGRRSRSELRPGDTVDFWRVEAIDPVHRLLLRSELRAPGEAWLQFLLEPRLRGGTLIRLEAYFRPRGLWGHLYWGLLLPGRAYLFKGMLRRLEHAVRAGQA